MERASYRSPRNEQRMNTLWCQLAILVWGYPSNRQNEYLIRSLPRSLTERAWDFGSADPSWNRMAAACGPPTNPRAAQVFVSAYPPKLRTTNDHRASTTCVLGLERFVVSCCSGPD